MPDQFGLNSAGSAGGVAETLTASFVHPQSRFHDDGAPRLLGHSVYITGFTPFDQTILLECG